MHTHLLLASALALACCQLATGQDRRKPDSKSKQPPAGAPWTKDFAEAHRLARKSGRPIFVYSTKTY